MYYIQPRTNSVSKILVKILIGKHPTEMIDLHLLIVGCRLIASVVQSQK